MTAIETRLHPLFASEIVDIDRSRALSEEFIAQLRPIMDRDAVCILHFDEPLSPTDHVSLSRMLGPLDDSPTFAIAGGKRRLDNPHIIDISNLGADSTILEENARLLLFRRCDRLWHTDTSFHPNRGIYSLLSGRILPPDGGDTEFVDMRVVYDALPAAMKDRIEDLIVEHSIWHSRQAGGFPPPTTDELASRPPVPHRLVQTQPGTGRKTLYLAAHVSHVVGWPAAESQTLLSDLMAFSTQPQFVYAHKWRVGDLAIWDNRITMHRGTWYDDTKYVRELFRTTTREFATVN